MTVGVALFSTRGARARDAHENIAAAAPLITRTRAIHPKSGISLARIVRCKVQARERSPSIYTARMTTRAAGTFDVTMNPDPFHQAADGGIVLGRLSFTKQFHGDLEASSIVQMLSAGTSVKGSAGYVAIERVVGQLHGRDGSFILQHSGTMTRGQSALTVSVVPDSGTDNLKGLAGQMSIEIVDGIHRYGFDYTLDVASAVM